MSRSWFRWSLTTLIALSAAALAWNRYGMATELALDASSAPIVMAQDDRIKPGGMSVAGLIRSEQGLTLDCAIVEGYPWPFCLLQFFLNDADKGQDLSRFDTMRLRLRLESPQREQRVRVLLMNHNPAYSTAADGESHKAHELLFDVPAGISDVVLPLDKFNVAGWWISHNHLAIEDSGPELDNVMAVMVGLGAGLQPGQHRLVCESIVFTGKLISPADLRLIVIAVWVMAAVAAMLIDACIVRAQLREASMREAGLKAQTSRLANLAQRDPLTGALNRRGLADALAEPASRTGPTSLVMMDIDHFKSVNDRHGHDVGDAVLRQLATKVQQVVQRDDVFARWGGEEFVLVCRNATAEEARRIAERLRSAMRSPPPWPHGQLLTCSFGVAEQLPGESIDDCITRADQALYRAKQGGRDCVVLQTAVKTAVQSLERSAIVRDAGGVDAVGQAELEAAALQASQR